MAQQQTNEINAYTSTKYKDLSDKMDAVGLNMFDEIVNHGKQLATNVHSDPNFVMPSVQEIADAVATRYAFVANTPVVTATEVKQPEVIPTVNGGNKTQVAKPMRSLEELQKLHDTIAAGNGRY